MTLFLHLIAMLWRSRVQVHVWILNMVTLLQGNSWCWPLNKRPIRPPNLAGSYRKDKNPCLYENSKSVSNCNMPLHWLRYTLITDLLLWHCNCGREYLVERKGKSTVCQRVSMMSLKRPSVVCFRIIVCSVWRYEWLSCTLRRNIMFENLTQMKVCVVVLWVIRWCRACHGSGG